MRCSFRSNSFYAKGFRLGVFHHHSFASSIVPASPELSGNAFLHLMNRRHALAVLGGAAAFASLRNSQAQAQNNLPASIIQTALGEGQRFDSTLVVEIARQLAKRPFAKPDTNLPGLFADLNQKQYAAITPRPGAMIWGADGRDIGVIPLHRGSAYIDPVDLFVVEEGVVRRIAYNPAMFDFGALEVPKDLKDISFSGFRLSLKNGTGRFDFAEIQGATFFKAVAKGQDYGTIARALTLKPADLRGEEFPFFRAFWIERPPIGENSIICHGLIDSNSVSGATRLIFRPGDMTIVDVETTLIAREALEHIGIGALGTSYLHGANRPTQVEDIRPEVHKADGLQILTGRDEWLWRPINNPETLQISTFIDKAPKGFGLLQRNRAYEVFQDDVLHYERRPSVWVEPLGDWGEGVVQLIEIPSDSEINDNILSYWRPNALAEAGAELSFVYRLYWCWSPTERPPLATVASSRVGRIGTGLNRRFAVDFKSDSFASPQTDIQALLEVRPGVVKAKNLFFYPERKTVRVTFDLDLEGNNASELRLVLDSGGRAASETWLYRWAP